MNKEEIWKDIAEYEGIYQVSNLGKIKSINYRNTGKERLVKGSFNNCGYKIVILTKNKKQKAYSVHRIVAKTFIPNAENKSCVNHIDCDKKNNSVKNLEWCSQKENIEYMNKLNRRKANKHLTNEEVEIIKCKKENKENYKEVWQEYKDKITLSDFEKIWYGQNWI